MMPFRSTLSAFGAAAAFLIPLMTSAAPLSHPAAPTEAAQTLSGNELEGLEVSDRDINTPEDAQHNSLGAFTARVRLTNHTRFALRSVTLTLLLDPINQHGIALPEITRVYTVTARPQPLYPMDELWTDSAPLAVPLEPGAKIHGYWMTVASAQGRPLTVSAKLAPFPRLIRAATLGDLETVQALVTAHPALVSQTDTYINTPLHYAAAHDHVAVARVLLDHGAPLESHADGGQTPLLIAVQWSYVRMTRLLLSRGADVHARDTQGLTVLEEARVSARQMGAGASGAFLVQGLLEKRDKDPKAVIEPPAPG